MGKKFSKTILPSIWAKCCIITFHFLKAV